MKRVSLLLAGLIALTQTAFANEHQTLSESCRNKVGTYQLKHHGRSLLASVLTYELTVTFEKNTPGMELSHDWDVDQTISFDFDNMTIAAQEKLFKENVNCYAFPVSTKDQYGCDFFINHWSSRLQVVEDQLVTHTNADWNVLKCVKERLRLFAQKNRDIVNQRNVGYSLELLR